MSIQISANLTDVTKFSPISLFRRRSREVSSVYANLTNVTNIANSTAQLRTTPNVQDYCYYVNGVCFIWASPCSGVVWCSQLPALSTYDWFCPWGMRYATQSEWDAGISTLDANRDTFFQKCAAGILDPRHDHCDYYNTFVREPNNSYNELVLVCPPPGTATPSPTPSPTVVRPAEDYCFYVNGVCFIWASP